MCVCTCTCVCVRVYVRVCVPPVSYLIKLKETEGSTREVVVLALSPAAADGDDDNDDMDYIAMHSYFDSRQRFGVINCKRMPEVRASSMHGVTIWLVVHVLYRCTLHCDLDALHTNCTKWNG